MVPAINVPIPTSNESRSTSILEHLKIMNIPISNLMQAADPSSDPEKEAFDIRDASSKFAGAHWRRQESRSDRPGIVGRLGRRIGIGLSFC
jgi:hypothetical protein